MAVQLRAAVSPEFAQRRAKARSNTSDGVLVLFGNKEGEDLHYGFFQDTNFFYLTGCDAPGAVLIMTPEPGKDEPGLAERLKVPREILFLPQRVPNAERWTGRKMGPNDPKVQEITGFATVMPAESFESELQTLLAIYPSVITLTGEAGADRIGKLAPLREVIDARPGLARLRMIKSESEIAKIQKATDASVDAHRAAWRMIEPGKYEYQVAAVMVETYMNEGCQRSAYTPIVGSGPNSTTLHYSKNSRRMDAGEIVVMDVAGECDNYASDITRTVPAGGKFSPRQREIYEIVLGAQKAAIAAVKPGVMISGPGDTSLYKIAYDYINTHGKDLHGKPLGQYFTHGLSHDVGLDVHDEATYTVPLKANMVITVEPGIYIPEENIGVRIEDVVLVTDSGARVMSAALPKDPGEIERAIAEGRNQ